MKRTFKDADIDIAITVGTIVAAIGTALWAIPLPWLFPFGQNAVAGAWIFIGVLTMIFGEPK